MWYRCTTGRIGTVTVIAATATGGITRSATAIAAIGVRPGIIMNTGAITTLGITVTGTAIDLMDWSSSMLRKVIFVSVLMANSTETLTDPGEFLELKLVVASA